MCAKGHWDAIRVRKPVEYLAACALVSSNKNWMCLSVHRISEAGSSLINVGEQ